MEINPELSNHHPDSIISVKCSCANCDSDSCFAKRSKNHRCAFQMCDDRKTYQPENDYSKSSKKCCDYINAIYLNATKPNINTELEELTDDEINYESERKTLMEMNQPSPNSLDEYLDRLLCVDKAASKFKQKAPSLSGYIEIISENAEYKRKLNLFNDYVQTLKNRKYSKGCDDVTCFTAIQNSLRTQQWYNTLSEISGQPKTTTTTTKSKSRTLYRCLDKEEPSARPVTQIQNTTINQNTQKPKGLCEICDDSYGTSASKDNSFFKYNIFKKLKDACLACSCKVCECIAPKSITNDICKCKPCQCAECIGYATAQAMFLGPLSPTLTCSCSEFNDQSALREQDKCSCVPGECEISNMYNLAKRGDVPASPLPPLASVSRITCICSPCNCSECLQNNTATDEKSKCVESNVTNCDQTKGTLNEIYRNTNNKNKNIKENFVALCTGMPRFSMNHDYESKRSKTCICKECECITCICKENTINALKSSELFSTIDEENHLLKSNSGTNNNYGKSSYRVCESCSRKMDLLHHPTDKCDKQTSRHTFDSYTHLSDKPINPKSHLNRCRCTNCRCERCIAHKFVSNYSSIAGVGSIKKGDVLSPLAHQTKLQNLKLEEMATPTPICIKDESRYRDVNLYVNSRKENNMNYRDTFKKICPKDVSSQPSVSRQANCDMGTMLSKSFNRLNILQCDAYVHSQAFNIPKPVLRNSFTSSRSRSSINSITGPSSQVHKNHSPGSENTMKSLKSHRSSYDNSELGVKNKISEKREEITLSKLNENESSNGPYFNGHVLKDPRRANNIFTEMIATKKIQNKVCSSHKQAKLKEPNRIDNSNTVIVSNSNQPMKCLSTSAITTLEKLIASSSEQIKSKSSNGNNFNCFRMLNDLTQASLIENINHYNSPKVKLRDWSTNDKLLAIKKENEKARQTIEDAKKFSLHLLNLLEMYEKANNEFVKTSDELKTAYRSILDRNLAHNGVKNIKTLEKYDITRESKSELSLEEHATPTLNINMVSTYEPVFLENIIAKRLNCGRIASKQPESNYMNGLTTTNVDFGILETVSDDVDSEEGLQKNCERICYAKVQNGRSKRNLKHKINPEYDKHPHNSSKILAEITRYADLKSDEFESLIKSIEHEQSISNSADATKQYVYSPKLKEEEVKKDGSVCKKSFGLTAKPNITSEGAGISEVASLQVGTKGTMLSISVHSNTTNTIKIENTRVNKALSQLQLEVRKLLELAILEPLNYVDESEDSFLESPSLFDESLLNLKIKELSKENKAINEQPEQADKEIWCSEPNLLDDFKRQIREQLKIACMHPLMNKQSSLFSYSCKSECDDLKARFLVVRKISEHTALIEWSQPLGLDVKGYELLVDGKTVQLILNPSKCMTAVTCLPHAEKILLTIRTITFVMPEVGHYPTTTTIYRPYQQ